MAVSVFRIYDDEVPEGHRVLVDRLWPRGIKKSEARLDEWLKDVAPSSELRRWYGHEVEKFEEFARRYRAELARPPGDSVVEVLVEIARRTEVILLTATKDVEHSGARVLLDHIRSQLS